MVVALNSNVFLLVCDIILNKKVISQKKNGFFIFVFWYFIYVNGCTPGPTHFLLSFALANDILRAFFWVHNTVHI